MFDTNETRPLRHGFAPLDVSVNGAVEPGDFDARLLIARMPECAHFLPLGGIARVSFRHDNLLNLEPLKCIVFMFRSEHSFGPGKVPPHGAFQRRGIGNWNCDSARNICLAERLLSPAYCD